MAKKETINVQRKSIAILCVMLLLGVLSCKPPAVFVRPADLVIEDLSGVELISSMILRYQQGDTVQYLFDNRLTLNDYPHEVCVPYVCYMPNGQSGVLGLHTEKSPVPPLETQDYENIVGNNIFYFPLYQYHVMDSTISFRRMTQDERITDTRQISSTIYAQGESHTSYDLFLYVLKPVPEVKMIYNQFYSIIYNYLNKRDALVAKLHYVQYCKDPLLSQIPMFYLPLDSNVYYKKNMRKHLVKKRVGFCPTLDFSGYNHLADYRHEIDTALLALPVRIFQEKYLQANDLYCLDGVSETIGKNITINVQE